MCVHSGSRPVYGLLRNSTDQVPAHIARDRDACMPHQFRHDRDVSTSGQHQRRGAVPQSVEASRRQLLTRPTGQPLKVAEWLRSLTNRGPRSLVLDVRIEPISARPPLTSQGLKEDEDRVKYHSKALE